MVKRPVVLILVCFGLLMYIQSLVPIVMGMKRSSDMNEFMIDDQRTHKRKNYMVQQKEDNMLSSPDGNMYFDMEPLDPDTDPEELSALIVDYANMIRNDVILLDNSVETRTRKRGNIKVEKKYNNQAIPDPSCSCNFRIQTEDLGVNTYPRYVETRKCYTGAQKSCVEPYRCEEDLYNLPIIRRKSKYDNSDNKYLLPRDLESKWIAKNYQASVGCTCTRNYTRQN